MNVVMVQIPEIVVRIYTKGNSANNITILFKRICISSCVCHQFDNPLEPYIMARKDYLHTSILHGIKAYGNYMKNLI
jgi:hypothetical protein